MSMLRTALCVLAVAAVASCGLPGSGATGEEELGAGESALTQCGDLQCVIPTNERFAIETMREIHQALAAPNTDFLAAPPPHVSIIIRQADGSFVHRFKGAIRHGYLFTVTAQGDVPPFRWSADAYPVVYTRTGIRSFYIDETGVLLGSDISGADGSVTMPEI